MGSHLTCGVNASDCTNRIRQWHKLASAKQVNNEDLDHQLGCQTLTALLALLVPIDQGFHTGSAQFHRMINYHAQIPSYQRGSFIKASLHDEKLHLRGAVSLDMRQCILFLSVFLACHILLVQKGYKKQYGPIFYM